MYSAKSKKYTEAGAQIRATKRRAKLSAEEQSVLFNGGAYDAQRRTTKKGTKRSAGTIKKFQSNTRSGQPGIVFDIENTGSARNARVNTLHVKNDRNVHSMNPNYKSQDKITGTSKVLSDNDIIVEEEQSEMDRLTSNFKQESQVQE